MGSGCGIPIAEKILRLPDNSPFWQHFTQGLLLCSPRIIHYLCQNVNRKTQFFAGKWKEKPALDLRAGDMLNQFRHSGHR